MRQISRRDMIAASSGLAGLIILPSHVLGRGSGLPPSEKLNLAFVGIGTRGSFNLRELENLGHNIVAICDVDWRKLEKRENRPRAWEMAEKYSRAKKYDDWRVMLEKEDKTIDGVVVSTPDHDHAVVSLTAMKMGKHVYCEKPMAHSVEEVRAMMASEKKHKVSTQTGCQGHSSEDCRNVVEWIRDGAIGDVRDVHIFANNSAGTPYARLGKSGSAGGRLAYDDIPKRLAEEHPVPNGLLWDLWLGPAASRSYNPLYSGWRSWVDFGDGAIGNWCCHYFDPVVWALDLGLPEKIEANPDAGYEWATNKWLYPNSAEVRWEFPARGKLPPVAVTWHYGPDGGTIPLPKYWKEDYWPRFVATGELANNGGVIMVGSNGAIVFGAISVSQPLSASTGLYRPVIWTPEETTRLVPDELNRDYKRPARTLPRPFSHWADWVEAAKTNKPAGAPFAYGGLMTELGLLGNIACTQRGKILYYDGKAGRFKNSEEANTLFRRSYRDGFALGDHR